jgi:hypothetical protein
MYSTWIVKNDKNSDQNKLLTTCQPIHTNIQTRAAFEDISRLYYAADAVRPEETRDEK